MNTECPCCTDNIFTKTLHQKQMELCERRTLVFYLYFLAVQNSSIGDLVTHWVSQSLTFTFAIQRAIPETCDRWNNFYDNFLWWFLMTIFDDSFWWHFLMTVLEICDIWDTDYNSDNWEPEFMTIIVTWQLIVTLDSIRNSCDVCVIHYNFFWFHMTRNAELQNSVFQPSRGRLLY